MSTTILETHEKSMDIETSPTKDKKEKKDKKKKKKKEKQDKEGQESMVVEDENGVVKD